MVSPGPASACVGAAAKISTAWAWLAGGRNTDRLVARGCRSRCWFRHGLLAAHALQLPRQLFDLGLRFLFREEGVRGYRGRDRLSRRLRRACKALREIANVRIGQPVALHDPRGGLLMAASLVDTPRASATSPKAT